MLVQAGKPASLPVTPAGRVQFDSWPAGVLGPWSRAATRE